ncbi:metallophosphoesterase [bacterium]|nr:metallophosphoesterase [bacterium]
MFATLRRKRAAAPASRDTPPDPGRRRLLRLAAGAVPAAVAGGGGLGLVGISGAGRAAEVSRRRLDVPRLPPGLSGLRIAQLSDLHLGGAATLARLDAILAAVRPHRPDLVVVTGDIADDLRLLPGALDRIAALAPPLGVFACLGNHEYGVGIRAVREAFGASPIRLLVDAHRPVRWHGTPWTIAAVDDPGGGLLRDRRPGMLPAAVDRALDQAEAGRFTLLLSHRPEAFDPAAARGVGLTLAGHTHGGQVALGGRSILALTRRFPYPWGLYRRADSLLYVTSGAGQWLPFRLGCPAEVPIFDLHPAGSTG